MNLQEALEAMCERCHKNSFRHISDDYCEEYETIKRALAKAKALDIIKDKATEFKLLKDNDLFIRAHANTFTRIDLTKDESKAIKEALK